MRHDPCSRSSAVSPRPQTTRRKHVGIVTLPNAQVILVDTPGMHIPQHKLGNYMNEVAVSALQDADCIVWLVDASEAPTEEDRLIAARLTEVRNSTPVILALNKADLVSEKNMTKRQQDFLALVPQARMVTLSALKRESLEPLLEIILQYLPTGYPFYDDDQVTDLYEREIAVDLIREACMLHLSEEIPHAIAVRMDEFTDRNEGQSYVAATIFVERESHKGIVIGQNGSMLKKIGSTARKTIEDMTGRKIYLELRVKLNKNWRDNPDALRLLGYIQPKDED